MYPHVSTLACHSTNRPRPHSTPISVKFGDFVTGPVALQLHSGNGLGFGEILGTLKESEKYVVKSPGYFGLTLYVSLESNNPGVLWTFEPLYDTVFHRVG